MTIYVTGDKHGEMEMHRLYKKNRPFNPTIADKLIIAGDFGGVWSAVPSAKEAHFLRYLNEAKWETLFVDGNHENHELLQKLPQVERYGGIVGKVNDAVYHLRRGEIYEIDGKKILTFGGALSIDKLYRLDRISWWEEEIPSHAEMENAMDNIVKHGNKVDYVITHTCPTDVLHFMRRNMNISPKFDDPTCKMLSHLSSMVEFKEWYFGHWHENKDYGKYKCLWHNWIELK